jgi:Bacteriocin-protection, YdeI or OmpD-Associated
VKARNSVDTGAQFVVPHYDGPVRSERVPGGVVHKLPADLRQALIANTTALDAWKDITPLARNEFICWVEDAKQQTTRERRIRRTQEELEEGQRRPCCWPGCRHRDRNGGSGPGSRSAVGGRSSEV